MSDSAIASIAVYRNDVVSSLRQYFNNSSPSYQQRFLGYSPAEVIRELRVRIEETDRRSSLAILISLERAFRVDYEYRYEKKVKGHRHLFRAFRTMHKSKGRARLDEDIFEAWKQNVIGSRQLIAALRSAFKFRHWLAHGEYWELKGRKYDFDSLYDLADEVLQAFDFVSPD